VVGDMALFMVANNLTAEEVWKESASWRFRSRSWSFLKDGGAAAGRFPKELQKRVLRGANRVAAGPAPICRLPISTPPERKLQKEIHRTPNDQELLPICFITGFPEFAAHQNTHSDTSVLPTPVSFTAWNRARR